MTPTQELWQRVMAGVFIMWMERMGEIIMPLAPRNEMYYVVATMFNAFMVVWMILFFRPTSMVVDVRLLLVTQALMQLMGLVLYQLGEMPFFYNTLIKYIVSITYIRIVIGSTPNMKSMFYYAKSFIKFLYNKRISRWER